MSMVSTLSSMFGVGSSPRFERFHNRSSRDVYDYDDDDDDEGIQSTSNRAASERSLSTQRNTAEESNPSEEGVFVNNNRISSNISTGSSNTQQQFDIEEGVSLSVRPALSRTSNSRNILNGSGSRIDNSNSVDDHDTDESDDLQNATGSSHQNRTMSTMSLAELEEERDLARRRSSACVLFALIGLFRLWIMALQENDLGLLLLCLIGTSWTARWIRYNQEQEDELSRAIANYSENQQASSNGTVNRHDLRLLSFQAQLALAIMESQRQMMEGGYGNPDGDSNRTPGVSDESRSKWESFLFKIEKHKHMVSKGKYGSVALHDYDDDDLKKSSTSTNNTSASSGLTKDAFDEEPHCSICLGEYEEDEKLTKLPCGHFYHDECISSWCSNHTRCPLCNHDLNENTASNQAQSHSN